MSGVSADGTPPADPAAERLASLDALRGFDMFWIIGGAGLMASLAEMTNLPLFHWLAGQAEHPEWHGFKFWDLIFPLFMFVAGVSMPFSLAKRKARGATTSQLYAHACRRGLVLVLLGLVYNGLLLIDPENLRYPSVLGRIGLGYTFAAFIVISTSVRGQAIWTVGILLGYWAAMTFIAVPGYGAGSLFPGQTLTDYIDRNLLPGKLYKIVRDPEGLFSTVPAIATVLFGVLAGHWLRSIQRSGTVKSAALLVAGAVCLALGMWWDGRFLLPESLVFPINKNLWTSSFVLYTSGWSLILLALFYLVIDVLGWKKWSFFFIVIGANAITVYLAQEFIDFGGTADIIFARATGRVDPHLLEANGLTLKWLLLYVMYRQRIFLRV